MSDRSLAKLSEPTPELSSVKYTPEQYAYEKIIGKRHSNGSLKLKRLTGIHRRMIAMHLRGMANKDIALVTGYSEMRISHVLRDDLSLAYINAHMQGTEMELAALAPMAVDALRNGLCSNDEKTALLAADKFFKASGKYNQATEAKETAEDVIMRMLAIAENQSGAIRDLTRADPAANMIDVSPAKAGGQQAPEAAMLPSTKEKANGSDYEDNG